MNLLLAHIKYSLCDWQNNTQSTRGDIVGGAKLFLKGGGHNFSKTAKIRKKLRNTTIFTAIIRICISTHQNTAFAKGRSMHAALCFCCCD